MIFIKFGKLGTNHHISWLLGWLFCLMLSWWAATFSCSFSFHFQLKFASTAKTEKTTEKIRVNRGKFAWFVETDVHWKPWQGHYCLLWKSLPNVFTVSWEFMKLTGMVEEWNSLLNNWLTFPRFVSPGWTDMFKESASILDWCVNLSTAISHTFYWKHLIPETCKSIVRVFSSFLLSFTILWFQSKSDQNPLSHYHMIL